MSSLDPDESVATLACDRDFDDMALTTAQIAAAHLFEPARRANTRARLPRSN
jgi:hypothetical protein